MVNFLCRLQLVTGSFLDRPRINFVGQFRADVATRNNVPENYKSIESGDKIIDLFNPEGTNTFSLLKCRVTSVVLNSGLTIDDEIVGQPIVANPGTSLPKLVALDTHEQLASSIFGLKLGLNWNLNKQLKNAFLGDFLPSVIERDVWQRQADSHDPNERCIFGKRQCLGAHCSSKLINVKWSENITSKALNTLKQFTHNDNENGYSLSVILTLFNYSRIPEEKHFLYGSIIGSIGVSKPHEPKIFPENRVMKYVKPSLKVPSWSPLCELIDQWVTTTYFDVIGSTLTIDFGNSFPIDTNGELCRLYRYFVGLLLNNQEKVEIISELPYRHNDWYQLTVGIQDFELNEMHQNLIKNHKVALVVFKTEPKGDHLDQVIYPICSNENTHNCVYTLLVEDPYLITPMDYSNYRLEKGNIALPKLKVRHFGSIPTSQLSVTVSDISHNAIATESDLVYTSIERTDETGVATFRFVAGDVGTPRKGIDGQLFIFTYCICEDCKKMNFLGQKCEGSTGNYISFFVWSHYIYEKPYFWDPHIQPIFSYYEKMFPAMSRIIKLGDYDDVIKPHNINLILFSMSLHINHPGYMPASRDLSPTKIKMIKEWLMTSDHPRNQNHAFRAKLYEQPSFCTKSFLFHRDKLRTDNMRRMIKKSLHWIPQNEYGNMMLVNNVSPSYLTLGESEIAQFFAKIATVKIQPQAKIQSLTEKKDEQIKQEAEFLLKSKSHLSTSEFNALASIILNQASQQNTDILPHWYRNGCSKTLLKNNLQTAIELEFATIPPYLTALYSIKDGHNQEAYQLIRSVVMQEMVHLAQAANLLTAIGGRPIIDSPYAAPSYPGKLPGGVLPGLNVTLQKASPKYIADTFMMIEYPEKIEYVNPYAETVTKVQTDMLTIGKLYKNIEKCMKKVYEKEKATFFNKEAKQITWPWRTVEEGISLRTVSNLEEALDAIRMIVEEGEGNEQCDPTYMDTSELGHFFKFKMLACGHHLRTLYTDQHYVYDFRGPVIQFTPEGVWPMRDNPSSSDIPQDTHAYHEAKTFHSLYRSLLQILQAAFDGKQDAIKEAVPIMSTMQIQAKKLMTMAVPENSEQTYGPVFDYDWKDS